MNVQDLAGQLEGSLLLDVRETDEWAAGHIPGALHIPTGEVEARVDEVNRDSTVYVMCRSGKRSSQVTNWLRAQGVKAENVDGGAQAWADAGYPLIADDEGQGAVA